MTDQFLEACFLLVLNENHTIKVTKTLYRDIISILTFYISKENGDIPILFKNKIECLLKICELKIKDYDSKMVADSITASEKYLGLSTYITDKITVEVKNEYIIEIVEYIKVRRKFCDLLNNSDQLGDIIESAKIGTFASIHDVIRDYENTIKSVYNKLMEYNRNTEMESNTSVDFSSDNYDFILNSITSKYVEGSTLGTGYVEFDRTAFNAGGFENGRLYIFGGESGGGKSTLMLNCMKNAFLYQTFPDKEPGIKPVYVYITLENLIDETFVRLYQSTFGLTFKEFMIEVRNKSSEEIHNKLSDKLFKDSNGTLICKYFPKYSIGASDIRAILDDVSLQYGKNSLSGLVVDYLDLLASEEKQDAYRLELSKITSALKDIAVDYNVPLITATQLGRGVYDITDVAQLTLASMSESIKKVEHADFIALMIVDKTRQNSIFMRIAKNRCGKSRITFRCDVEFDKFLFNNIQLFNNAPSVEGLEEFDHKEKYKKEPKPKTLRMMDY